MTLTDTERSLLIWFHNNLSTISLDQGAILHAYGEITDDPYDNENKFLPTIIALIENKMITRNPPPIDCFYMITEKGVKYLTDTTETTLIYQCDRCGDMWSPDINDDMILDAYLAENPDEHISVDTCEQCEVQDMQSRSCDYSTDHGTSWSHTPNDPEKP